MNDQQQLEYIKTEFDKNLKDGLLNLHVDWLIKQVEMLQNAKPLIPWQKYDPENPPEKMKKFLVSSKTTTAVCILTEDDDKSLTWFEYLSESRVKNVTHYAVINLPGEETTE